ncbi:hypothetical protein PMAYCL1PPCAC_16942, partial [Pristionchus mayeri]
WSNSKKLVISFMFPCVSFFVASTSFQEIFPSKEFEEIMTRMAREVYGIDHDVIVFGGTMRYPDLNYGRTLKYFAFFYAILPYSLAYTVVGFLIYKIRQHLHISWINVSEKTVRMQRAFFLMQLLQTALPMAILWSPFTVFIYAAFTQTDLDLAALWFGSFLWLCPTIQ